MDQLPEQLPSAERYAPPSAAVADPAGISLADIAHALLRSKLLILVCVVICVAGAAVFVALAKPVYEASAMIRIDPSRAGSLGLSDLLSLSGAGLGGDETLTEITVLKSDEVAFAALNSLDPDQFRSYAGFDKGTINLNPSEQRLSSREEGLVGAFKSSLSVKQIEGTQLISISFRNGNPETAAILANHVISAYLRQNFDSRYNSVNQAKIWLSAQMDELKDRAANAQRKLASFQERNGLLGADASNNTTFDRLKLLNESLTQAESNRILKEAQMRVAASGDAAVLATLLPDPKLQSLQTDEGNLYAQYLELSTKFGAAYPPLVDVKQQLARVKAQINEDVSVISGHLKEEYEIANRTEAMLRGEYQAETEKAYALNRTQADYAVLVAEGTSSRDLFNTLQYKLQQASVDAGLNSVNTMVVDRARAPLHPIAPKKGSILAFAALLGLAGGIGGALLRESLADEVRNATQLEDRSGFLSLSTIPHHDPLTRIESDIAGVSDAVRSTSIIALRSPQSRGSEAYRTLRNSVVLSGGKQRVILITSASPGEGKTLTSANYAVVEAQQGSRVLLVDADLRRPGLHRLFGLENTDGLAEQIAGELSETGFHFPLPELPNLAFLPAGAKPTYPSYALGSQKFQQLLREWQAKFDCIILDSAPILTVSDSLPLASRADSVILVVRAGVTPLKALQRAKLLLSRARAHVAGAVLNDATNIGREYGYYSKDSDDYYK